MSKLKATNMRNVWFSCAIILLSIAGILHTYIGGGWSKKTGEAAKTWPRMVYLILIAVAVYLLIRELMGKAAFEPPAITMVKWWNPLFILLTGFVFLLFCVYVGTVVGVFVYLFAMICLFDEDWKKHWKVDLAVALVATVAMWLIFTRVLPIVTMSQYLI